MLEENGIRNIFQTRGTIIKEVISIIEKIGRAAEKHNGNKRG